MEIPPLHATFVLASGAYIYNARKNGDSSLLAARLREKATREKLAMLGEQRNRDDSAEHESAALANCCWKTTRLITSCWFTTPISIQSIESIELTGSTVPNN